MPIRGRNEASAARAAGIAAIGATLSVWLGVGIAGVVTPGYSAVSELISASQLGPYGWLVVLGLGLGGVLTLVLALLLARVLPAGSALGPALLVLRGCGTFIAAVFVADVGPIRSLGGTLHVIGFVGGTALFAIALPPLAWRMRRDDRWRRLVPYTIATGIATAALLVVFIGFGPRYVGDRGALLSDWGGLIQRVIAAVAWSWQLVLGAWLMRSPVATLARE